MIVVRKVLVLKLSDVYVKGLTQQISKDLELLIIYKAYKKIESFWKNCLEKFKLSVLQIL